MGTLWCSIKPIEAPYLLDWEQGIALHAMQGDQVSSLSEGKFQVFSGVGAGTWGTFSSYGRGSH